MITKYSAILYEDDHYQLELTSIVDDNNSYFSPFLMLKTKDTGEEEIFDSEEWLNQLYVNLQEKSNIVLEKLYGDVIPSYLFQSCLEIFNEAKKMKLF